MHRALQTPRGTEYVILAPQGYAHFVVSVDNQVVKGADLLTGPFIWKDTLLSVLQTQQDGVRIAGVCLCALNRHATLRYLVFQHSCQHQGRPLSSVEQPVQAGIHT